MSGQFTGELFPSYSAVEARREWEIGMIKEKLARNEKVDTAVCRAERVSADTNTLRFGLKRGKLLYLFKYPTHDVEREKHRNVITRARFIKNALESAGYRLIPWDFKKGQPPTFWSEGQRSMEEEDDDLYGPSETVENKSAVKEDSDGEQGDEPMDEGLESGEEEEDEEEEESDSDIDIIIDKPTITPAPKPQPQENKAIKIVEPTQSSSTAQSASNQQTPAAAPSTGPTFSQSGANFPAVRTSSISVNADPIYPPLGKPVSQIDIDADLAESTKPWRLPGADQSDYFNYGFDEFTWEMYRQRQSNMAGTLQQQKAETAQFQQMFMPGMPAGGGAGGGGGGGGVGGSATPVPGAPTGPSGGAVAGGAGAAGMGGGMPGMPDMNPEQMQMMAAQMAAQGMDVSNMDFNTFMSMMGGGMPAMGGGMQQGQAGGYGGGGQQGNQGGGGRGSGRRGRGW